MSYMVHGDERSKPTHPIQPTAEEAEEQRKVDLEDILDGDLTYIQRRTALLEFISSREALAAYSASQEVLRSVEDVPNRFYWDEKSLPAGETNERSVIEAELDQMREGLVEAAKTACEKFPKP